MTKKRYATYGDNNAIQYFWLERGDITRWSEWNDVKHLFPEIVHAIKQKQIWANIIDGLVRNLKTED